jgi:hypothetical protein
VAKLQELEIKKVVNFLTDEEIKAGGSDRLPDDVSVMQLISFSDGVPRVLLSSFSLRIHARLLHCSVDQELDSLYSVASVCFESNSHFADFFGLHFRSY